MSHAHDFGCCGGGVQVGGRRWHVEPRPGGYDLVEAAS